MLENNYFPGNYFTARAAFRQYAARAQLDIRVIAATGPDAEPLSIDSAYLGSPSPRQLVVLTSGLHGVEGYAGSALQQLWLAEFAGALPADSGVLLVHALNPYGFVHGRRVNEHNVDLNRNALARFPGPANHDYASLSAWLNPPGPAPRIDDFLWTALPLWLRHGRARLAQAIAAGQYAFPQGLFYGGTQREPSLTIFAELLAAPHLAAAQRVWHLDLHTGLGRYGQYQLLLEEPPGSKAFALWADGFGVDVVKSDHAVDPTHYRAHGILPTLTRLAFPQATVLAATVEFGTFSPAVLLKILRAENRVYHFGARHAGDASRHRQALREALAPRDPQWRADVIGGGRQIFAQLQKIMSVALR